MSTYRLTMNGFKCVQWSWDNALELDGKGDEMFMTWSIVHKKATGDLTGEGVSSIYGDVGNGSPFPGRIRAGSRSPAGGIQSNDEVPAPSPWVPSSQDGFPILLWEADLAPGDTLAVVPLIWEWDGGVVNHGPILAAANSLAVGICGVIGGQVAAIGAVVGAAVGAIIANLGIAGNRPIGHDPAFPANAQSTPWPSLVFNSQTAQQMAGWDSGYGPGIFARSQKDPDNIGGGHYLTFMQLTKLN